MLVPGTSTDRALPPTYCGFRSKTSTAYPRSASSWAALIPATPPPMIMTRFCASIQVKLSAVTRPMSARNARRNHVDVQGGAIRCRSGGWIRHHDFSEPWGGSDHAATGSRTWDDDAKPGREGTELCLVGDGVEALNEPAGRGEGRPDLSLGYLRVWDVGLVADLEQDEPTVGLDHGGELIGIAGLVVDHVKQG